MNIFPKAVNKVYYMYSFIHNLERFRCLGSMIRYRTIYNSQQ